MAFVPQPPQGAQQMPQPPQMPPQMGAAPGGSPQDGPPSVQPPPSGPVPTPQPGQMDQQQQPQQPGDDDGSSDEEMENFFNYALSVTNLVPKFKDKKNDNNVDILEDMGQQIIKGFDADENSRKDWMANNVKWLKMATLVAEPKTYPWPKASNVKYPLLATAAMQFSARAFPALVPSDGEIVKTKITQQNPNDDLYQAASRISQHMSYQVLQCIPNWEEDMDRLLMIMSITGICFKETFHDSNDNIHRSQLVLPQDLVVNYGCKSLCDAYRVSRLLRFTQNEVETKFRSDVFEKVDLEKPTYDVDKEPFSTIKPDIPEPDKSTPHLFVSCHTYWDLDDDGYEEPYVITVHYKTKQVVRIIPRWDLDGVKLDKKKKVISIKPVEYFTAFPFIPNPDGSIYALGFGALLGPLNEAVDSNINILLDSGHLSTLQSGFIGKGLRIKIGTASFQPGEWKVVNATGDDLSKSIFPLPTKEPSSVLMSLLNMLITSGNQLASIAEIFVGKMPGQNTPATTTQETIQQGMAVFTAIYKRVYRSMMQEFQKLYRLNKITPDMVQEESKIAGIQLQASDYDLPENIIVPGADPVGDSGTVKQSKLQQVGQLLQLQTINPQEYTKRVLQANEIPNYEALLAQPQPPPPDPKAQTEQAKQQTEQLKQKGMQAKQAGDQQMQQTKLQVAQAKAQLDQQQQASDLQFEQTQQAMQLQGKQSEMIQNHVASVNKQHHEAIRMAHDTAASVLQNRLDLAHQQQMGAIKRSMAAKPKSTQ